MASKTTTKGASAPKNTQTSLEIDVDEIADNAKASKGFLPIANFGDKTTPGEWRVTFLGSKPRTVEKEFDDGAPRLAIDARIAQVRDGATGPASDFSIFLRLQTQEEIDQGREMHSLTNGVLALYRESGKDLNGVQAVIRKRVYDHKKKSIGKTCAYDVLPVHDDE